MTARMFSTLATLLLLALTSCASAQLPAPAHEPPAGTRIVHPVDGAIMVYVPAGQFIMGMDAPQAMAYAKSLGYEHYHQIAAEEWFPQRTIWLPGYFVDQYEVTNERWARFLAGAAKDPKRPITRKLPAEKTPNEYALYPAESVLWAEAARYANWAGKRLPTEEQWEKAARGTDGRIYPWGNDPLAPELGIFVDLTTRKATMAQPVGSRPKGASPYGAMDMAGNVYEWTDDWQEPYPNNPEADRLTYLGRVSGCLRGGSFYHGPHTYSAAKRFGFEPDETYFHVGFRTVWEPPPGYFESEAFAQAQAAVAAREAQLQELRKAAAPKHPH